MLLMKESVLCLEEITTQPWSKIIFNRLVLTDFFKLPVSTKYL